MMILSSPPLPNARLRVPDVLFSLPFSPIHHVPLSPSIQDCRHYGPVVCGRQLSTIQHPVRVP
jgi:hypothetical protein